MLVDRGHETVKKQEHTRVDQSIYEELGELTKYVEMMTRVIGEMEAPVASTSDQLPQATAHLSELAKMTEEGTHQVMTLTEEIRENQKQVQRLVSDLQLGLGETQAKQANNILTLLAADEGRLTGITVALSFQDLVAQRVGKLMTVLEEVQHKLLKLVVVFGIQKDKAKVDRGGKGYQMLKQLEASKSTALKQNLVDDILSEFGFN